jgi:rRNA maturation RNase YbeY
MARTKSKLRPARISIQAFNRQQSRRVHLPLLKQIAAHFVRKLPPSPGNLPGREKPPLTARLAVHLINAAEMTCLNEEFLGHAGSTDVITFDYRDEESPDALCGEVFISVDDAIAAAPRFRVSWTAEIVRYLAHGLLHLRGYDDHAPADRRQMKGCENKLLKDLSRSLDCAKLERLNHAA